MKGVGDLGGPETQGAALGCYRLAFQAGMSGAITGDCPLRAADGFSCRTLWADIKETIDLNGKEA
ncbi:MAG: hypothetical protein ABFD91_01100 [Anaerohalosphaeraceae bacterium]